MLVEDLGGHREWGGAILPPQEYLYQFYFWPRLGLVSPCMPARLDRAHTYIRSIAMEGNRAALVTCATMDVKLE
jgi:hypothetical protein